MTPPLEHDYIGKGLAPAAAQAAESSSSSFSSSTVVSSSSSDLKTELRLGLSGSESPDRNHQQANGSPSALLTLSISTPTTSRGFERASPTQASTPPSRPPNGFSSRNPIPPDLTQKPPLLQNPPRRSTMTTTRRSWKLLLPCPPLQRHR
ncbi:auxin-responsive protein IAA17-like [Iris pallida]|uniref:Auxin-responsive protein IAA17-like n=1 Tax=Iris pallida TaxID=29817 RepID=A0AAX6I740_IRIPA|nr:auxin-responsive protein IAA17-like [Iris pallida]